MAECVIVACETAEEVATARAFWEDGGIGLKLLACNPAEKFTKVKLYEFDAAAQTMPYRENDRYILIYTG